VLNEASAQQRRSFFKELGRSHAELTEPGSPSTRPSMTKNRSLLDEASIEPSLSNTSASSAGHAASSSQAQASPSSGNSQNEASAKTRLAFGITGRASTVNLTSMVSEAERDHVHKRFDQENKACG
jgi:hypothetical protein